MLHIAWHSTKGQQQRVHHQQVVHSSTEALVEVLRLILHLSAQESERSPIDVDVRLTRKVGSRDVYVAVQTWAIMDIVKDRMSSR